MIPRTRRNSSRVNFIISTVFHAVLIASITFLAAREGILGKKLKQITAELVKQEKKIEPQKPKEPERTPEPPKEQKMAQAPRAAVPEPPKGASAPPPMAAPAAAPPAAALPAFDFSDGAKQVQTTSDPVVIYKGLVEYALRSHWVRPEGVADSAFAAEIEISVDPAGKLAAGAWKKASGHKAWDDSVKLALAQTKAISRPPPKNFPDRFWVRFDVELDRTEPMLQASAQ